MAARVVAPSPEKDTPERVATVEDVAHPDGEMAAAAVAGRSGAFGLGDQWRIPGGFDYIACAIAAVLLAQVLYWALPQYNVASEFIRKDVYIKSERGDSSLVLRAKETNYVGLLDRKYPEYLAQQWTFTDGGYILNMADPSLVVGITHANMARLVQRQSSDASQRWFWDGHRIANVFDPDLVLKVANDNRLLASKRVANETRQLWRHTPDKCIESLHKFEYVLEASPAVTVGGRSTGRALAVYGRERAADHKAQLWVFFEDGTIRNRANGMYLQVSVNNDVVVLGKADSIEAAVLASRATHARWWYAYIPEMIINALGSAYGSGKDETGSLVPSPLQKWVVLPDGSVRSGLGRNFVLDLDDDNRAILWERKPTRRPNQSWNIVEKEATLSQNKD
eukprot:Opistho-2@80616